MSVRDLLHGASGATPSGGLAVEDVFSAYTYTGTGAAQNIVNGLDLDGQGGLVWIKDRVSGTYGHALVDTINGQTIRLASETVDPGITTGGFGPFNSDGFGLKTPVDFAGFNQTGQSYVSWSSRQADKFFTVAQAVVSGANVNVDLSSLGSVGLVLVKKTSASSNWYALHRKATIDMGWFQPSPMAGSSTYTHMYAVACRQSDNLFVGVGDNASAFGSFSTSSGGSAWTTPALMGGGGHYSPMFAVTVSPVTGRFVSVGGDGITPPQSSYSDTGTSWASPSGMAFETTNVLLVSVACSDTGKFVAVGWNPSAFPVASATTDGALTWSLITPMGGSSSIGYMKGVAVNAAGRFVAIGYDGSNAPITAYSDDGTVWTSPLPLAGVTSYARMVAITCNKITGRFVAVGTDSANYLITSYSDDGVTWSVPTLSDAPTAATVRGVCVSGAGQFVAVGNVGNYLGSAYSMDGVKWTGMIASHTSVAYSCYGVASGATNQFVTVGHNLSAIPYAAWAITVTQKHRLLYLNMTSAETVDAAVSLAGTTLTLVAANVGNGTFTIYAWAHDESPEGIVQCGSYLGQGVATGPDVQLGWEPQYLMIKSLASGNWGIYDASRGLCAGLADKILAANGAPAESFWSTEHLSPMVKGFGIRSNSTDVNGSGVTYVYIAIRRGPMKKPTVGTQVYNAINRAGTQAVAAVVGVGFPPDIAIIGQRTYAEYTSVAARLRGTPNTLVTQASFAGSVSGVTSFNMDGIGLPAGEGVNGSGNEYINWFFQRRLAVVDVVVTTGTGADILLPHSLGVMPEFAIVRPITQVGNWQVIHFGGGGANAAMSFALNNKNASMVASTMSDTFTKDTYRTRGPAWYEFFDAAGQYYSLYLFASMPGICKVGSYNGNGATQVIPCGFTTGARFVVVKRADVEGPWYVWDTVRGIIVGNDPRLEFSAPMFAEVTDDSLAPDLSGFAVNQIAATNINVTASKYVFLAFA